MQYTNAQMEGMIESLRPLLDRRDRIGYVAARDTRILMDEAHEYLVRKQELIREHGTIETDSEGNPTGSYQIAIGSPAHRRFVEDIREWAEMRHEPDIMYLRYEEAEGKLSGNEILACDWLFEE